MKIFHPEHQMCPESYRTRMLLAFQRTDSGSLWWTHGLSIVAGSGAGLGELLLWFRTLGISGVGIRRDSIVAL